MKFLFLFIFISNSKAKISSDLLNMLTKASFDEKIYAIVHLKPGYPYNEIRSFSIREKVEIFKNIAEESQREVIEYLEDNFKGKYEIVHRFWVYNGFHIEATKEVIYALANLPKVKSIYGNKEIKLVRNFRKVQGIKHKGAKTIEWNILRVCADSCWLAGYDGSGVIIGHIDTGVDTSHPALSGKWLSPYWFDGVNGQPSPYDDSGHGTHTMGTILGGDGFGPFEHDIGVAPGARFVCAKAFNEEGIGTYATIDPCMQVMADWKSQGIDIKAVGNSWGGAREDTHFWDAILTWKSLGIFPVFSIGNSGPNHYSANAPGNYPLCIGVGATDNIDNIAWFSSRGPAPTVYPWNDTSYWYTPDWNYVKPDISAPGVGVMSSVPGGGYESWNGTSMASPHVTGGVAILCQKNPNLTPEILYQIFTMTTSKPSQGMPYPNNDYGWGIVNLYQALLATPGGDVPFIVINNYELNDGNNNYIWEPGETAAIVITLKNYGADAQNISAILSTESPYVTVQDSESFFGDIPHDSTVSNSSDPYLVEASSSAPWGASVKFYLYITGDGYNDTLQFIEYIGVPGQDWADHNCGSIILTITRYGAIGFMNSQQTEGHGCAYGFYQHLYYGGYAIGNSSQYVIDRYYEGGFDDDDWVTLTEPDGRVHMQEPGPLSDEYAYAIYNDSGGEIIYDIECRQNSWAWSDSAGKDFVIMEFILTNKGSQGVSNLYSALFMDWDIEGDWDDDLGSRDATRKLAYMYDGFGKTSAVMGSAILNPPREVPAANLTFIYHPDYVYPYGGLPDSLQIKFMDGTLSFSGTWETNDWSTCISSGPFNLNPGETIITAFVIAGGENLTKLKEAVDTAYNRYWNILAQKEHRSVKSSSVCFSVYPLIMKKDILSISYSLQKKLPVKITFYNSAGQKILVLNREGKQKEKINIRFPFPTGIYFVNFQVKNLFFKRKIIKLGR